MRYLLPIFFSTHVQFFKIKYFTPSFSVIYKFQNKYCNCRTSSNWSYPVSNQTLNCFSETTEQNQRKSSAKARTEERILTFNNTHNQSFMLPQGTKALGLDRTPSPESCQKQRVCCPGGSEDRVLKPARASADQPFLP